MNDSDARAMLALMLAIWPTPALPAETKEAWVALIRQCQFELQDWERALAEMNELPQAFRPHVSEVIATSTDACHRRLQDEFSGPALPPVPDSRPECCRKAEGTGFGHWLEAHATEEERAKVARFGLERAMGAAEAARAAREVLEQANAIGIGG